MKIKFLAGAGPAAYDISGTVINGLDISAFTEGARFIGNKITNSAGIFDIFLNDNELHVVLAQPTKTSGLPWRARDAGWIDAANYVPGKRYVEATDANALALIEAGKAEYFREADGRWSVRIIEAQLESIA